MRDLEVVLPVTPVGDFDSELMKRWADFSDEMDKTVDALSAAGGG